MEMEIKLKAVWLEDEAAKAQCLLELAKYARGNIEPIDPLAAEQARFFLLQLNKDYLRYGFYLPDFLDGANDYVMQLSFKVMWCLRRRQGRYGRIQDYFENGEDLFSEFLKMNTSV